MLSMLSSLMLLCLSQSAHQISHVQPQGYFDNEMQFSDADGDGDLDLYVAVYDNNARYIDIHYQQQNIFSPTNNQRIEVPNGVIAWAVDNFLPAKENEPDPSEIIWMASRGIYVRPAVGRLQVLLTAPMLLDLPSYYTLPRLHTVADIDADGLPEMVVFTTTGYQIIQHDGTVSGIINIKPDISRAPIAASNLFGGKLRPSLSSQELSALFVPNEAVGVIKHPPSLYSSVSLPAPVWSDVNGDGLLDLSYQKDEKLSVHLQNEDGTFLPQADRVFNFSDNAKIDYEQIEWLDADGDSTADLLLVSSSEDVWRPYRAWTIRLFLNPYELKDLKTANGLFGVESTNLGVHLFDINGDDATDVCLSNWKLDLGFAGRGTPRLEHIASAFLATESGWSARSSFTEKRAVNVDKINSFVSLDTFVPDLTGNGLPDFVELSDSGSLRVRQFETSGENMVSVADSITIDLPLQALESTVKVEELNGDVVSDIIVLRRQSIEIYMSTAKSDR
jgi:hypothetical protein